MREKEGVRFLINGNVLPKRRGGSVVLGNLQRGNKPGFQITNFGGGGKKKSWQTLVLTEKNLPFWGLKARPEVFLGNK